MAQTQAQPPTGFGSAGVGPEQEGEESLEAYRGVGRSTRPGGEWPRATKGVLGHHCLPPGWTVTGPSAPSSPQPLSVLEATPAFGWGELVHVPHLVVGLVTHGEGELVAEANLLLLGVGKQQDLGDR